MISTSTPIIEIKGSMLAPAKSENPPGPSRLFVARGDVIAIVADVPADGRRLLRILATLERPATGEYRFNGTAVNLKDYRQSLTIKRQIGYVAADAALISNRTVRENLLLARFYFENDLSIDLDETVASLCRDAGLTRKLDQRPSVLSGGEMLKVIAIREMAKAPAVMLIDRPESFMQTNGNDAILNQLKYLIRSGTAVVLFSHNQAMIGLANRELMLADGAIRMRSV